MRKYQIKIDDILQNINDSEAYTFTGSYGEDNNITIWTHEQFVNTLDIFYTERSILIPVAIDKGDTSAQEQYFRSMFNLFKSQNGDNLARAFSALLEKYNPLENYNGTETITTVHGKKIQTEYDSSEDLQHGLQVDSTSSVYGYNSAAPVPDSTASVSNTGTDSTNKSGSDTVTNSGTDTVTNIKAGNIGVTTNQAMLTEEMAIRFQNFSQKAIKRFLDPITIY